MTSTMLVLLAVLSACGSGAAGTSTPPVPVMTSGAAPATSRPSATSGSPAPTPGATIEPLTPQGTPANGAPARTSDLDGDGRPDIVTLDHGGYPEDSGESSVRLRPSSVQVVYGSGRVQVIAAADVLGTPAAVDNSIGRAGAVGDLNRDGYADLVVSGFAAVGPEGTGGAPRQVVPTLWALWGSPAGLSARRSSVLAAGAVGAWPFGMGAALAFVPLPEPTLAVTTDELPGGAVRLYRVRGDGTLGRHTTLSLGSAGVAGRAWARDRTGFGDALAASGNVLVVSDRAAAPRDGTTRFGAAHVFVLRGGGRYATTRITRDTPGVAGRAVADDSFGRSVSVLGDRVLLGAPFARASRGSVTSLRFRLAGDRVRVFDVHTLTQDSAGVPGTGRAGHLFGTGVLAVRWCRNRPGALVFAAGTDGARDETSYGGVLTAPITNDGCTGSELSAGVEFSRGALGVARAAPSGRGDVPVAALRDDLSLRIGTRTVDLTSGGSSVDEIVAPAA